LNLYKLSIVDWLLDI